jgi:hypothetical protein
MLKIFLQCNRPCLKRKTTTASSPITPCHSKESNPKSKPSFTLPNPNTCITLGSADQMGNLVDCVPSKVKFYTEFSEFNQTFQLGKETSMRIDFFQKPQKQLTNTEYLILLHSFINLMLVTSERSSMNSKTQS